MYACFFDFAFFWPIEVSVAGCVVRGAWCVGLEWDCMGLCRLGLPILRQSSWERCSLVIDRYRRRKIRHRYFIFYIFYILYI